MALACVAVLVLGMSMTTLAANPSVQAGVVTGIDKVVDKNNAVVGAEGSSVEIVVEAIGEDHTHDAEKDYISVEANMKKELERLNAYEAGMKLLDVKNVKVVGDAKLVQWPVTITFTVNGIKAGDKVILLHYVDATKGWEKIDTTTGNGTVTATFNSLSPVAFIKVADATSPTTGEPVSLMLAGAVVALGTVGTVISKKRK